MSATGRRGRRAGPVAVIACALTLTSCGSSTSNPVSPSAALALGGTWTGAFTYTTGGVAVTEDATVTLLQPGQTASGSWQSSSLATGTLSFTAASTIGGSFTVSQPNIGGSACTGSSTVSGTASVSDLVLNVANLTPTTSCPWATGMKFTLRK